MPDIFQRVVGLLENTMREIGKDNEILEQKKLFH